MKWCQPMEETCTVKHDSEGHGSFFCSAIQNGCDEIYITFPVCDIGTGYGTREEGQQCLV
jgi:hypothetical protein